MIRWDERAAVRAVHNSVTQQERRLNELLLWAISTGASSWMIDLQPYEQCRVVGVVERLIIDPVIGSIEVTATDGTDRIVARWSIRRPTPQLAIVPGGGIQLEGVPVAGEGGLVLIDPAFQSVPFPAIG